MPDAWARMSLPGRMLTALLVLHMGVVIVNGQTYFIDGVQEGVLRTILRR